MEKKIAVRQSSQPHQGSTSRKLQGSATCAGRGCSHCLLLFLFFFFFFFAWGALPSAALSLPNYSNSFYGERMDSSLFPRPTWYPLTHLPRPLGAPKSNPGAHALAHTDTPFLLFSWPTLGRMLKQLPSLPRPRCCGPRAGGSRNSSLQAAGSKAERVAGFSGSPTGSRVQERLSGCRGKHRGFPGSPPGSHSAAQRAGKPREPPRPAQPSPAPARTPPPAGLPSGAQGGDALRPLPIWPMGVRAAHGLPPPPPGKLGGGEKFVQRVERRERSSKPGSPRGR